MISVPWGSDANTCGTSLCVPGVWEGTCFVRSSHRKKQKQLVNYRRWRSFWVSFCLFQRKERERTFLYVLKKKKKSVFLYLSICWKAWGFSLHLFGLLLFSITAALFTSPTAAQLPEVWLYQDFQEALLKSRKISAPWHSCVSSCTVPAVPVKVCRCTKESPEWVTRSHIWPVHNIQQLTFQFPPKSRQGLQKCFNPLQKSFLFCIPVCLQFSFSCGMVSGKAAEQPLLHTTADVGTKEM